jgi:hypothetical protein
MRCLYSAAKLRRGVPDRRRRVLGRGAAPFLFDMFNIVTGSLLALDS